MSDDFVTVQQLTEMLGDVSQQWVYDCIRASAIPAVKVSGRLLIPRDFVRNLYTEALSEGAGA